MKINTNELGHMTNMAAMPICGKNQGRTQSTRIRGGIERQDKM